VGLHGDVDEVIAFTGSWAGRRFLEEAEAGGLAREYELHAMSWLLPRERFAEHPEWFRMDRHGERRPDANLCPAHPEALAVVAARAGELAERRPPSTRRGCRRCWRRSARRGRRCWSTGSTPRCSRVGAARPGASRSSPQCWPLTWRSTPGWAFAQRPASGCFWMLITLRLMARRPSRS